MIIHTEIQTMIESHGITVIRTNPEMPNAINGVINQIYMHINKSTKKKPNNELKNHSLIIFH